MHNIRLILQKIQTNEVLTDRKTKHFYTVDVFAYIKIKNKTNKQQQPNTKHTSR